MSKYRMTRVPTMRDTEEILLPIIAARPETKEKYSEEFEKVDLIVEVRAVDAKPNGECCVLVARKAKQS